MPAISLVSEVCLGFMIRARCGRSQRRDAVRAVPGTGSLREAAESVRDKNQESSERLVVTPRPRMSGQGAKSFKRWGWYNLVHNSYNALNGRVAHGRRHRR